MVSVPVVICEAETKYLNNTKDLLTQNGFDNLTLFKDTQDLLDNICKNDLVKGSVVILGLNNTYSLPCIETAKIIKQECPNVMIIGSGFDTQNRFALSLIAIRNGCDSWVEKEKKNYQQEIINKVKHWTKYIKERNKLIELYTF